MFASQSHGRKLPVPTLAPLPSNRTRSHARRQPVSYIPRPRNAFILFRADCVRQRIIPQSVESNHRKLSSVIGKFWKDLTEAEKAPWVCMANNEKEEHLRLYPGYQFPSKAGSTREGKTKKKPPVKSSVVVRPVSPNSSPGSDCPSLGDCRDTQWKPNDPAIQRLMEDFGPLNSQSIFVGTCGETGMQDTSNDFNMHSDDVLDNTGQEAVWSGTDIAPSAFPLPGAHLTTIRNNTPYFPEAWNIQSLSQPGPTSFDVTPFAASLPEAANDPVLGQTYTASNFMSQVRAALQFLMFTLNEPVMLKRYRETLDLGLLLMNST